MELNSLEKLGKKRTILISISIIIISLHTIYYYNSVMPEIETKKIIQQSIRFLLTVWILILIYQGKNWARIIMVVLAVVAVAGSVFSLIVIDQPIILKTPFLVMTIIYSMAIYFFGFSKSYKAFAKYQRMKDGSVTVNNL